MKTLSAIILSLAMTGAAMAQNKSGMGRIVDDNSCTTQRTNGSWQMRNPEPIEIVGLIVLEAVAVVLFIAMAAVWTLLASGEMPL